MNNPLVSICVVTYNSSEFVLETLESAKAQTYQNIELIISDDCSSDNTVQLCRDWVEENSARFVRCVVIVPELNTGVAANLNRAISASHGEWIKSIAGDDVLMPNCIDTYVSNIAKFKDCQVFFSRFSIFHVIGGERIVEHFPESRTREMHRFCCLSAREQYINLLNGSNTNLSAASAFIKKELLDKIPYNEMYKFMEDYPMWVALTGKGYKFEIIETETVMYRHHESLSSSKYSYFSARYFQTKHLYFWNEKYQLLKEERLELGYDSTRKTLLINDLIDGLTCNKVTRWNNIKVRLVFFFVNKFIKFRL